MNNHNPTCVPKAKMVLALIVVLVVGSLVACSNASSGKTVSKTTQTTRETSMVTPVSGSIYLYGEAHGEEKIIDKEFDLWSEYYLNEGMRHLFVEMPYFTAEYLNLWMQSDNDDILAEIYDDWEGTASHNPYTKAFYKKIKEECPETMFHGTDIGHQFDTTGRRFLSYLAANNQTGTEKYNLTIEAIQQGRFYYNTDDDVYRENKMTTNFIREFRKLGSENVMGIYGSAHTGLDELDYRTQTIPCMANQLKEHYGDIIYSEDLSWIAKDSEPSRIDSITLQGKEYVASYFGRQDLTGFKEYVYREFWRLEDAYIDVKDLPLMDNYLPYDNYPMLIETGQVFIISYTKNDGSMEREYHLSSGQKWGDMYSIQQFTANVRSEKNR